MGRSHRPRRTMVEGRASRRRSGRSAITSTAVTSARLARAAASRLVLRRLASMVAWASMAVRPRPSCQLTSGRRCSSSRVPSADHVQLSASAGERPAPDALDQRLVDQPAGHLIDHLQAVGQWVEVGRLRAAAARAARPARPRPDPWPGPGPAAPRKAAPRTSVSLVPRAGSGSTPRPASLALPAGAPREQAEGTSPAPATPQPGDHTLEHAWCVRACWAKIPMLFRAVTIAGCRRRVRAGRGKERTLMLGARFRFPCASLVRASLFGSSLLAGATLLPAHGAWPGSGAAAHQGQPAADAQFRRRHRPRPAPHR